MAQTYTRQSTLTDGDTITASLFNNEYNQIVNAFAYSSTDAATTGHRHDGSSAQGGNIPIIGDLNFFNKIVVDGTNNHWGIFVEVAGGPVEQVRIQDGAIVPVTNNDIDLGTGALQFKDIFIDGTANIDSLVLSSGSTVTAILDEDNLVSDSATALATQQSIKAYVDAQVTAQDLDIVGDTGTDAIDLDSETLTFTGGTGITSVVTAGTVTHNIDSTVATLTGTQTLTNKTITSPDIDGGTIDNAIIGGTTAAAGSFTNITVSGTVDGRDVATDGTKLDGIEALADVTDTTNVTAAGALMDSELTNIAAVKALNQGVATTDSPSFASLTATTADINGGTIDGTTLGATTPASVAATTGTFSGEIAANGGIALGDNDQATFGDGDDLKLYHTGSHSYIDENGTGNLYIGSNNGAGVYIQGSGETLASFVDDGEVTLYHDSAAKLATTATGIDVTGTVTADGLTVAGTTTLTGDFNVQGSSDYGVEFRGTSPSVSSITLQGRFRDDTSASYWGGANIQFVRDGNWASSITFDTASDYITRNGLPRLNIASNGDISFYEDTGTTAKFFWDASAESLTVPTLSTTGSATIQGLTVGRGAGAGATNTAVGSDALAANTTGANNVATGKQALYTNTTGGNNTANGFEALRSNTTGSNNVANGYLTLRSNTTGIDNTASGIQALYSNTTGGSNTANGRQALYSNTTASNNTANGRQALYSNTTGGSNTANGHQSLYSNTTGSNNTANGYLALYPNTTGASNTANGSEALRYNTTGSNNVANGNQALRLNTTGASNTANGYQALLSNTTASNNVANGSQALRSNTTGNFNVANGNQALYSNTTGINNVAHGYQALYLNTEGSSNTANGYQALNNTTASNSTAIGKDALRLSTTGGNNTAIGYQAGEEITTGAKNTILGSYNGNQGGLDIRTASNFIVLSDGDGNPRGVFDASGNLLVGTTDANPYNNSAGSTADNGFAFGSGALQLARYNDAPLLLNRTGTNDGDIQTFWKSGVKVGSIGTRAGYVKIGNGDTHLLFNSAANAITPEDAAANSDGVLDLGRSTSRFKDLYLSGATKYGTSVTFATVEPSAENLVFTANAGQANVSPNFIFNASTSGSAVTERMRIDASGNLGLGVVPSAWDPQYRSIQIGTGGASVHGGTAGIAVFGEFGSNFYFDGVNHRYLTTAESSLINCSNGAIGFGIAAPGTAGGLVNGTGTFTPAMTLDSSGNLLVGGTTSPAGSGQIVATNGIYLGGTGAANHLDDYEEGTFTPYLESNGQVGSFTYTTQTGYYTKIGRVVNVILRISWSAIPTTGATFRVTGLPFVYSSATDADAASVSIGSSSGVPNTDGLYGFLTTDGGGSRSAIAFYSDGDTSIDVTTGNNISASGTIRLSLTYIV